VRLADAEPAVEVDADAAQRLAPAEQLLLACPSRDRLLAELPARLHGRGLCRFGRIRFVRIEADVGKRRRWNQLGDQSLGGHGGVAIDQMRDTTGPVHARTIATCCNSAYA